MLGIVELDTSITRAHQNFWIESSSRVSRGLNGRSQVVFAESRYWAGQLDLLPISLPEQMRLEALADDMRGRAGVIRVRFCNSGTPRFLGDLSRFYESVGTSTVEIAEGYARYDDCTAFDDGTGFALPEVDDPIAVSSGETGASRIRVDGYIGRNLAVGAVFSHNDFLYRVADNLDGSLRFNPPLRQTISLGEVISVNTPSILVRLSEDDGARPFREIGRRGRPTTIRVEEVFDR